MEMIRYFVYLLPLLSSQGECRDRRILKDKVSIIGSSSSGSIKKTQEDIITLEVGSPLNLTCLVRDGLESEPQLSWHLLGFIEGITHLKGVNTLSIIFDQVNLEHKGVYQCLASGVWDHYRGEEIFSKKMQLQVYDRKGLCDEGVFQCSHGNCIPNHHVCDGVLDCPQGNDEDLLVCGPDPCDSKLHCADGRCMDTNLCCNPDFDVNCTFVPKCCNALIEFHRNFNKMDMKFLQIAEDDNNFHSTILTVVACTTVFLIVFGFIFAIGIYHSRSSWTHQIGGRTPPRVRNTYFISNRVQTLERPPLHRPPSYRAIFGNNDPPPPYSENIGNSNENMEFDLNNNGDINGNSELIDNHEIETRIREERLASRRNRDSSSDDTTM
uniref:Ig-like domain-containing protein n=1 Tax=Lepeophtheirus salmonis TaxID=72036 RepID=A0A0K2UVN7_LEPSM